MLLLVRFLLCIGGSFFRRRIGVTDASVVRFTVLPQDCDLNVHLNSGRFISFSDVARVELLGRMRLIAPILRRGWRPVLGGIVVRYRRSIGPLQRFTITSRLVAWDAKWFYVEHVIESGGKLCAIAHARTAFRSREATLTTRDLLGLAKMEDLESPPLPELVARWIAAEDAR